MDGTVSEASLEEGRPERCGTPDGDGIVVAAGAVRGSCLVSADTMLPSVWFRCIVLLEATAVLAGAAATDLLAGGLGTAADFTAALAGVGEDFLAAVLSAGAEATLGLPTAALTGFAADFVAVLVVLEATLAFAGMAFTS